MLVVLINVRWYFSTLIDKTRKLVSLYFLLSLLYSPSLLTITFTLSRFIVAFIFSSLSID